MSATLFQKLIREAHRRSLWQVLAVYLIAAWGALQVADAVTESAGLPSWVPGFALVLLIIGLPIVLATAFVQEGLPGAAPPEPAPSTQVPEVTRADDGLRTHHRMFTWRNAIIGGVCAFALLGVAVAAYFTMRVTGIGPAASLVAQGVFDDREPIVLADFSNSSADSTLGRVVTEALRIDLHESPVVSVLPPTYVSDALRRMGRPATTSLTAELARELALRDGIKAVVQGDVGAVGSGYVVTASIVDATSGSVLAAFRETAANSDALLATIDKLSTRIRERAGESYRSIRKGEPLHQVTTSSFDALRAYTSAVDRADAGDREGSIRFLDNAIQLDSTFAMAYRKLAIELNNLGMDRPRARAATKRAYELRDRLTKSERLLAEANYHNLMGDRQRAIDAYRELLQLKPDDGAALNNLANLLTTSHAEAEEALALQQRAANAPGASLASVGNVVTRLWHLRRDADLDSAVAYAERRFPESFTALNLRTNVLMMQRQFAASHAAAERLLARFPANQTAQFRAHISLAGNDLGMGRMDEARRHLENAMGVATAAEQPNWYLDAFGRLLWLEAVAAQSPARARALLQRMDTTVPASHWEWSTVLSSAALIGDHAAAQRAGAALEASTPPEERSDEFANAQLWTTWARKIGTGDGTAALDAIRRMMTSLQGNCEGRRCWGHAEEGLALELTGQLDQAAAAYEQHMAGLPMTELYWDASLTPRVALRLAEIYDQQGNRAKAAEYYARYAEMWKDADAELQPRVQAARNRAATLVAR